MCAGGVTELRAHEPLDGLQGRRLVVPPVAVAAAAAAGVLVFCAVARPAGECVVDHLVALVVLHVGVVALVVVVVGVEVGVV